MNSTKNASKEKREIRIVFMVFSLFFSLIAWKNYPSSISYISIGTAVFLAITLTLRPILLRPAFKAWLKIAHFIGRVNTQIILTLFYYIVLTPFGLVMRIFGRDPMQRKFQIAGTYWEPYQISGLKDRNRYEKQF